MRVFISGKATGTTDYRERFAAAEVYLKSLGLEVVNPIAETSDIPEDAEWIKFMRRTIKCLVTCDAIYMLPDWRRSRGAKVEKQLAEGLGMIVMYAPEDEE